MAGGFFAPTRHSQPETLTLQRPRLPKEASSAPRLDSRRRKLWDIPHKFHCPVIGVCFAVEELCGLMARSLHRTDGVLAAADLVICQSGCISHNAYWRVKEQCKRTDKPGIFNDGAGVSSFGRVVSAACAVSHEIKQ